MGRQALAGLVTDYIAGELRAQKSRRQWTFDQIADRSGVPRSTVERALKGTHGLTVEVLIPLCQAMGLDAVAILREAVKQSEV